MTLFEDIANLDRLVHEPARMSILTALSACQEADFTFLMRLTGLTAGNLSGHLVKLKDAKLVHVEKQFLNNRPNTLARITPKGLAAIESHWKQLEELRQNAGEWKSEE